MKNYNNYYRNEIYDMIESFKQDGLNESDAVEKCAEVLYNCAVLNRTVDIVFKNKPLYINRILFFSTLYIDFIMFYKEAVSYDEVLDVTVYNLSLIGDCDTYEEVETLFIEDRQIFESAVQAVYEIASLSSFGKIEMFSGLDENDKKRILNIAPNFQYDIEMFDKKIDKEYIIKKINCMESEGLDENFASNELMCFLNWLKENQEKIHIQLIFDMITDFRSYYDKTQYNIINNNDIELDDEEKEINKVASEIAKMNDKELFKKFSSFEEPEYLKFGIFSFLYEETKYGKMIRDEKHHGK